jgi:hypothetical protein
MVGPLMGNSSEAESGAPGFCTVTLALPAVAIKLDVMKAVTCVALTKPVASGVPFHITIEPLTNPEPVTESWNADPPAMADTGLKLATVGAGGTEMVNT